MALFVIIILTCVGIAWMCYEGWYNSTDHSVIECASCLRSDAKIVNIHTEKVGHKQTSAIRTTVSFNDGFKYISHNVEKEKHLTFQKMTVTKDVMNQIILDAAKAHLEAISKNAK